MFDVGEPRYGGTNWAGMSVPDMWLAIGNQETTRHWELLTGWKKSYELTLQHMAAVKRYRENLAAAWPPEKSPAAAAYVAQLDRLITNLQQTYDAAVANYTAFSGATSALASARRDLEKVVQEYVANEGKLASFEEEKANRPVAAGKSALPPLKSPVADGRQAQLENQARVIMYGLSSEIMQARAQVAQPPRYTPGRQRGDSERDGGLDTYSPPPIPPVTPFEPNAGAASVGKVGAVSHPTPQPSGSPANITSQVPGLILGSANQPPVATAPTSSIGSPPAGPALTPTPASAQPLMPSPLSPQAYGPQPVAGSRGLPGNGLARPSIGPGAPPRAMSPGGVIGAVPGGGLGQPGGIPRTPSQVNPVGGLIGPNNTTSHQGPGGRGTSPQTHPVGQIPNRAGNGNDKSGEQRRWDPDNPWQTDEGVAPVLKPGLDRPFDPGPAIGIS